MAEYVSTRDLLGEVQSYNDVLLQGLARDRGLYVPTDYPQLSTKTLEEFASLDYVDVFTNVKGLFVGDDIPADVQSELAHNAFSSLNFPHARRGGIAPIQVVGSNLYIQSLSEGPTAAFKDMALQPLAQDMQYVLGQRGEHLTMLGATSGDTGSAAEAAMKGLGVLSLFMLSPEVGMSSFQKAQMGNLTGGNIYNISIPGPFDDCQDLVKAIKEDPEFAGLGAVNSINWGRIASQVPYYVSGYLQVARQSGDFTKPVDFVVPTGNFGNVLAGHIARKMGVPIRNLIIATNENNVVDELLHGGVYKKRPKADVVVTSSPSMDIAVASNYERLAYELLGNDPELLSLYMGRFERNGSVSFDEVGKSNSLLKNAGFDSGTSKAADRLNSIKWLHDTSGLVIDPHTADGLTVARRKKRDDGVPMIVMSTALPVKFEDTINKALGLVPERHDPRFENVERGLGGFVLLQNDPEAVKDFIRANQAA